MHTKRIIKLIKKGDGITSTTACIINKAAERLKEIRNEMKHLMDTGEFDKLEVSRAMVESLQEHQKLYKTNE